MKQQNIRNFSIIAHIDHGKSTLADRLLEVCGAVAERDMESQLLDNMDLERERGITIKARAVTMDYTAADGETYTLNLIDTPGHVDFNYEVSRSLAACEGAVLVVDASQGIEAQTLANTYLALDNDLEIRPVVNKIDLPAADPERVKHEIEDIIGIPAMDAPEISAKVGINIPAVLEDVVANIPAPKGDPAAPLRALIFDSYYDAYKGVIVYFRVMEGTVKKGMNIRMMASGAEYQVLECGLLRPLGYESCESLQAGQVGYLTASIKNVRDTQVGDTVTGVEDPAAEPLPGYRRAQPMVYCGVYTEDGSKYPDLRDALEKLQLNDASLTFEPESSVALGFGFRCGFLGMLHSEIIQERLEREFDLDLVTTLPSVIYEVTKTDGTLVRVDNPHNYPDPASIAEAREPFVKVSILTPNEYVGNIMPLCQDRRGEFKDMQYLDTNLVELHTLDRVFEIIYDFFDTLKAHTKGYASLDYELSEYRASDLVKVDLLLNGEQVDALSFIAHRDKAYPRARRLCEKLKENIPRQLFEVPIQAAIGGRIIARETVKAMRKDVLAKCYGGDITGRRSCWRSRKRARRRCGAWVLCSCPRRRSWLSSSWTSRRGREHLRLALGAPRSGAARERRTSVFAGGENLGAGAIHLPRACKIREGSPGSRRPLRGGAGRRCGVWALCSCPRRLSWLSSSWTSRRIEEKGGTLEAPPFWFGTILGAASPKDLKNETSPFPLKAAEELLQQPLQVLERKPRLEGQIDPIAQDLGEIGDLLVDAVGGDEIPPGELGGARRLPPGPEGHGPRWRRPPPWAPPRRAPAPPGSPGSGPCGGCPLRCRGSGRCRRSGPWRTAAPGSGPPGRPLRSPPPAPPAPPPPGPTPPPPAPSGQAPPPPGPPPAAAWAARPPGVGSPADGPPSGAPGRRRSWRHCPAPPPAPAPPPGPERSGERPPPRLPGGSSPAPAASRRSDPGKDRSPRACRWLRPPPRPKSPPSPREILGGPLPGPDPLQTGGLPGALPPELVGLAGQIGADFQHTL